MLKEDVEKLFVVRMESVKLLEKYKKELVQNIRDNQGDNMKINNAEIDVSLNKIFYK